jgi:hypothetical protein
LSLFRNESPNLGAATTVQELSGFGAGNPIANNFKPTTRQFVETNLDAVRNTASQLTGWLFCAPWKCQIVQAKVVSEVSATSSATVQVFTVPVASQPVAPASGNQVFSAAQQLSSSTLTANTVFLQVLTTSASNLVLNAGDLVGYVLSATPTGLVGGLLQLEIVQLG